MLGSNYIKDGSISGPLPHALYNFDSDQSEKGETKFMRK